jgi:hypothetical protein
MDPQVIYEAPPAAEVSYMQGCISYHRELNKEFGIVEAILILQEIGNENFDLCTTLL